MSNKFAFKISIKHLFLTSVLILAGITVASIFLHFSNEALLDSFSAKFESYFSFSGFSGAVVLIFQEYFWLLLIIAFSMTPYGKVLTIIILLYKGFSVGIVSSLFCALYGVRGIYCIILMVLPQNVIYLFSLSIAAQISMEFSLNTHYRGQHGKHIPTDRRAYLFCFILTAFSGLLEAYVMPHLFNLILK